MTMNHNRRPPGSEGYPHAHKDDPQVTLTGRFKQGPNSDMITFSLNDGPFERVFIVVIPPEGNEFSPVYVKHKVNEQPRPNHYFNAALMGERRPRRAVEDDDDFRPQE